MQTIVNDKIKETLVIEKLENGLTIMVVPKKEVLKKHIIFGTKYGSVDNKFIVPGKEELTEVPNGIAHFLEHKMFEQENGRNSLDVLTSLGVHANAYTTNDHTAYLFECTENFEPALTELMDYIQHPYFTEENVAKEQGIIAQEIAMYDDYPEWRVYRNAMEGMYHTNPVRIDIAGTKESISHITKDILYQCYNTFYSLHNMAIVVCGDFDANQVIGEIKKRIVKEEKQAEIRRIYAKEPETVCKESVVQEMQVSIPMFIIGYKDQIRIEEDMVKRHIAVEILMNLLLGKSSKAYQELYEEGLLITAPGLSYDYARDYAYSMISGISKDPGKVLEKLEQQVESMKQEGILEEEFTRISKMIYGNYVKEYNEVGDICRMFLSDYLKGVNSFDYIECFHQVTKEYAEEVLKELFCKDRRTISIVRNV